MYNNVTVEIVEQPASNQMRFRYVCEGRSAGSTLGVNSTEEEKTYPAIRVLNYDGTAVVIVSCVEVGPHPYRPHPNCLVGKLCKRGVCSFHFTTKAAAPTVLQFPQLGIQCVKKSDVVKNLEERESLRVDPFKTGFQHKHNQKAIKSIQLDRIRLCFQVILKPDDTNPKSLIPLKPLVSDPIRDKNRSNMQLLIHDISDSSSPPCGGKKIMIFCDKVVKRDIRIRFYEEGAAETIVWEDWAHFKPSNVHKQVAISFKTPKYKVQDIGGPVNVFFRLQRTSDGATSNAIPFQYVPDATSIELAMNTKKRKIDNSAALYEFLQVHEADSRQKSKMKSNIDPDEAYGENVAPEKSNFVASNFYASDNNLLPLQSQTQNQHEQPRKQFEQQKSDYQWPQSQPLQSQTQNQHEQPDRKQFEQQKSDCQWPQPQPLQPLHSHNIQPQYHYKQFEKPLHPQNIQPQQVHHHKPRCEQPQYHQPQYQPMAHSQFNIEPSHGNYLSSYSPLSYHPEARNVYGVAGNLSSNNISNCGLQSQPIANYQNPIVDVCPTQTTYDAPTHHCFQQMGPVYAAEKVIIQQFCNSNPTLNQQQNVPEFQNVGDFINSDLLSLELEGRDV